MSALLLVPTGAYAGTAALSSSSNWTNREAPSSALAPSLAGFHVVPDSSSSVTWAYAGSNSVTASGSFSNGNGSFQYAVHGYYAWAVVYTQTNTSSTTFMVQGERTLLSVFYSQYCAPDCSTPGAQVQNSTIVGWQSQQAFANLTLAGGVLVNGTAVPALSLANDATASMGNVTQTSNFQGQNPMGQNVQGWSYYSTRSQGQISVDFLPALGLVPQSSSAGERWISGGNFSESTSASQIIHVCMGMSFGYGPCGDADPGWSGTLNGSVGLRGFDQGPIVLQGGIAAQVDTFGLLFVPFGMWDGLFLVPAPGIIMPAPGGPAPPPSGPGVPQGGNVTVGNTTSSGGMGGGMGGGGTGGTSGPAPAPNGPGAPGTMGAPGSPGIASAPMVSTNAIDVAAGLPHLGFVAAFTNYLPPGPTMFPSMMMGYPTPAGAPASSGATASSLTEGPTGWSSALGASPSLTGTSSPGGGGIQAQPISAASAEALSASWIAWGESAFAAHGGPSAAWYAQLPIVVAVLAAAVVAVLLVVVSRSYRSPRTRLPADPAFQPYRESTSPSGDGRARDVDAPPRTTSPRRPGGASERATNDPMDRLL